MSRAYTLTFALPPFKELMEEHDKKLEEEMKDKRKLIFVSTARLSVC